MADVIYDDGVQEERHNLRSYVADALESMGDTEAGRGWLMMAMNPADGLDGCEGMPDAMSDFVAIDKYTEIFEIASEASDSPTEQRTYTIIQKPDFLMPVSIISQPNSNSGDVGGSRTVFISQLAGGRSSDDIVSQADRIVYDTETYRIVRQSVNSKYHKLRILGSSISLMQNGAALIEQGRVRSCQSKVSPMETVVADGQAPATFIKQYTYQTTDVPSQKAMAQLPRGYNGPSSLGVYQPLWLGRETFQTFYDVQTRCSLVSPVVGGNTNVTGSNPPVPVTAVPMLFPTLNNGVIGAQMQGNIIGVTRLMGIPSQVNFEGKLVIAVEGIVQSDSTSSSYARKSPKHDPKALEVYKEFVDNPRLRAAYPYSWNAAGTLGSWLKNDLLPALKTIAAPVISGFARGGLGGAVAGLATGVSDAFSSAEKGMPDELKTYVKRARSERDDEDVAALEEARSVRAALKRESDLLDRELETVRSKRARMEQAEESYIPPPPPEGFVGEYEEPPKKRVRFVGRKGQ